MTRSIELNDPFFQSVKRIFLDGLPELSVLDACEVSSFLSLSSSVPMGRLKPYTGAASIRIATLL